jgi:hypothetical protein
MFFWERKDEVEDEVEKEIKNTAYGYGDRRTFELKERRVRGQLAQRGLLP